MDNAVGILIVVVVLAFAIPLSILALRVTFDINKWQKQRRKRSLEKLKATCTHTVLKIDGDDAQVMSLFHSPPLTAVWICRRCSIQTTDSSLPEQLMRLSASDPFAWVEREKQFAKLFEKLY